MKKTPEWERYKGFKNKEEFNKSRRDYRKNNKDICQRIENKPKRVYARTKRQAEIVRGIKWDLSFDEFMELWQEPCVYCDAEIKTIGIDRIDSKLGYTNDNICSCCKWCNTIKLDHTVEELKEQCKKILSNLI